MAMPDISSMIAAIGALGTAAFAFVDATKAFKGGVSNIGYRFIEAAVTPYEAALRLVDANDPYATIYANWLNGLPKQDQKAKVKALIRLGLTPETAAELAEGAPGVDGPTLQSAAAHVAAGATLSEAELGVLGRFDATVDAQLDAGFERAEQQYRNKSRVLAAVAAILLAAAGGWIVSDVSFRVYVGSQDFPIALLIGVVSVPLAPVAKDLTSAIGAAVKAFKSVRA